MEILILQSLGFEFLTVCLYGRFCLKLANLLILFILFIDLIWVTWLIHQMNNWLIDWSINKHSQFSLPILLHHHHCATISERVIRFVTWKIIFRKIHAYCNYSTYMHLSFVPMTPWAPKAFSGGLPQILHVALLNIISRYLIPRNFQGKIEV